MDMMHTICLRCGKPAVSIPFHYDELGMKLSYTHYSYCEKCLRDGLKMLKEQEPIAPSVCGSKEPDGHGCWWYLCGKCKKPIDHKDRFCKRCGQAVKWN